MFFLLALAVSAVVAGLEARTLPPPAADGNLYGTGAPLPDSLGAAVALAAQDDTIAEILGPASVHDFLAIAHSEWAVYSRQVTDWERTRYLATS